MDNNFSSRPNEQYNAGNIYVYNIVLTSKHLYNAFQKKEELLSWFGDNIILNYTTYLRDSNLIGYNFRKSLQSPLYS